MNGCIYCNEFDVCMKYTTDKATSFCVGRNCRDRKPSNSDRIRSMTDEELAEWFYFSSLGFHYNQEEMLNWLKQEAKNEG